MHIDMEISETNGDDCKLRGEWMHVCVCEIVPVEWDEPGGRLSECESGTVGGVLRCP